MIQTRGAPRDQTENSRYAESTVVASLRKGNLGFSMPRDFDLVSFVEMGEQDSRSYQVSILGRPANSVRLRMEVIIAPRRANVVRSGYAVGTARQAEAFGARGSRVWIDASGRRELRMLTPGEERLVDQLETLTAEDLPLPRSAEVQAAAE